MVVLILKDDRLSISLSFVILILRRSEWYMGPLMRMSSLHSWVIRVMNAKSSFTSDLVGERNFISRPL